MTSRIFNSPNYDAKKRVYKDPATKAEFTAYCVDRTEDIMELFSSPPQRVYEYPYKQPFKRPIWTNRRDIF